MKSEEKKTVELNDNQLEQVSGGTWGSERSESPVNNLETSDGTTTTVITNNDRQWLHEESIDPDNTSAWFGLKNNP